jgi:hypothetical protein
MAVGQRTSVGNPPTLSSSAARSDGAYLDEDRGYGWVMFAGIMIMIAGTLNVIYGIAAIANAHFYVANARYVFGDLNTWGWVVMLLGAVQVCAALGIWAKAGWARWLGVAVASVNAIAQLIFLPSYPFLSLALFAVDVVIVYGLVAYGGRTQTA